MKIDNQQPSPSNYGEGSTTISKESTLMVSPQGKRPIYLKGNNVVYGIRCTGNNKLYIGSAKSMSDRTSAHLQLLRKNKHKNPYLQNSYNKYGETSLIFFIFKSDIPLLEIPIQEKYFIDLFEVLNSSLGFNMCPDTRGRRGAKMSEEAKKKIGDFWRGKKFTPERIAFVKDQSTRLQGKAILIYTKDMVLVGECPSISEVSRKYNVSIAAISKQCSKLAGLRKSKNSHYIFRYKDIV